jgi:microsomal dipeptidase-like Zn-dependent dipeptidase
MGRRTLVLAVLVTALVAPPAHAATRYSLVHGCYSITGADGRPLPGAERVRMQATALGRYLLYRPDGRFVAAQPDGSVGVAAAPSPAADWRVGGGRDGTFTLRPVSGGPPTLRSVRFRAATGCAAYPEAGLDATGKPSRGATSYGRVGGLVEGHMHWMTYEYLGGRFHCGRPWDRYGIPYALPDCSSIEGPQGVAAPMQNFLNYGNPAQPHDTVGWPTFASWKPTNLTYEGTYWRWIERAWLGGLRLMVMSPNENRALCLLQANRETDCDEMETVRRSLNAVQRLQSYVDAQAGGPGKGFFQIVTDPNQARRVINQGRMAVVLEVEISEPFGCSGWDQPTCDQAQVDRSLDELHRMGVRSMLLLNKFDNPLTGVRFDSGPVGVLINAGNRVSAGSFWSAKTCTGALHDNTIFTPEPQSAAAVSQLLTAAGLPGGTAPAYPPAPHCNTRGLTQLGEHVVRRMMDLHMIVNPDHMSQAGVARTLSLLEARHYSGVISPHGWMDPGNWPRIWKLGGMAFPGHSGAAEYVKQWREFRPRETPYTFGWGYGADLGGLSEQPGAGGASITYPFKSLDGRVTFNRQRTGRRTFDYTKDGIAHYGLYADWFADLRRVGGRPLVRDLWNGAEAYLEMWERANGIRTPDCFSARGAIRRNGRGPLRLGRRWPALLRAAGQPQRRGRAWSYCVRGGGADVAELTRRGKVELVGSTAPDRRAGGVAVGSRHSGHGVRRNGAWAYLVRHGRVVAVATASRSLAGRPRALARAMRRLTTVKARATTARFEPGTVRAAQLTGRTLAGSGSATTDAALTMLCQLQVSALTGSR